MKLASITLFMGILVQKTFANQEASITLSCQAHRSCVNALASHNPVTLKCENRPTNGPVYWQYLDIVNPQAKAVTFIQSGGSISEDEALDSQEHLKILDLISRSEIQSGHLTLLSPRVQDTGIYTCRDEGKHLAYYEIDFQDSENMYVSHASLGQRVRPNATIDLGVVGTAEVFTVWNDWQPCNRCGPLGERKKLGFCYIKISKGSTDMEEPRPCGLLQSSFSQIQFDRTPELRIEMCDGPCTEITSTGDVILVLENYHTYLHADASLSCLMASIYKPMYWEHSNASFTYLQQMMDNAPYVLDKATGGGTLFIPILNKSDEGNYRCYVDSRLMGQFYVMFPKIEQTPSQHYTKVEFTIMAMLLFLGVLFVFGVLLSCRETKDRVIPDSTYTPVYHQ